MSAKQQGNKPVGAVMVVGGGSGGMEYALAAHAAGHEVTLYEQSAELGGAMGWAGGYKTLRNMEQIAYQPDWHKLMVAKLGIPVRLNTPLTRELALAEQADLSLQQGEGVKRLTQIMARHRQET